MKTAKEFVQVFKTEMEKFLNERLAEDPNPELELEKVFQQAIQAQHEATWAMAMEAFLKVSKGARTVEVETNRGTYPFGNQYRCDHGFYQWKNCTKCHEIAIRAIPCPPLQTTNEKTE